MCVPRDERAEQLGLGMFDVGREDFTSALLL